jgi:cephalosporin hydroxylase
MPGTNGVRLGRVWHVGYLAVIAVLLAVAYERRDNHPDIPKEFQTSLILRTRNYSNVNWLGHPIWQPVLDLWTLQETIAEVKPALLIECGTFQGGSSLFFAHLMDLMGKGRVITVDIEKQHDLAHPRITYLIGECSAPAIVQQIGDSARAAGGPVMVILDSDHSAANVTRELNAYAPMVTPGSFVHVQDGATDVLEVYARGRPGPLVATEAFLATHPEFVADTARSNRFIFTHHPKGWLRRTTEASAR